MIVGFLDHTDAASCNHADGLQLYSGNSDYGNVTFTGNLCYDDYDCIAGFDGTQNNTITDNACFDIESDCISLYADSGSVVNHNTQQTGGADPSGCATGANIQRCSSSQLFDNGNKSGDPAPSNETYTNNVSGSGPGAESGSLTTDTRNMWSGASSPNISGSPTFVGGAHPTTWAGFELTAGIGWPPWRQRRAGCRHSCQRGRSAHGRRLGSGQHRGARAQRLMRPGTGALDNQPVPGRSPETCPP